jgi:2-polyprenyl-3-methyl-5-hydroxy-6-metoxy-1,4-benzoquinol methylase
METFDIDTYTQKVKEHQAKDDPTGCFDWVYETAKGDHTKVFWADLEPSPYLIAWLKNNPLSKQNKKACVIGCGVGDDAQALSEFGFEVTAFDISPHAIELCKNRYPNSTVHFIVADLFDYPKSWFENFDVVYECNTIQVLPGLYRKKARAAMSNLLAKKRTYFGFMSKP